MLTVVSDKKTTRPTALQLKSTPKAATPKVQTKPRTPSKALEIKKSQTPTSASAPRPSHTSPSQKPVKKLRKPKHPKMATKPDSKGLDPGFETKDLSKVDQGFDSKQRIPLKTLTPGSKGTLGSPISPGTPSKYHIKRMDDKDRVKVGFVVANGSSVGMHVVKVTPGLPADLAGLQVGDVVHVINGQKTAKVEDFRAIAASFRAGDSVPIKIMRGTDNLHLVMRIPKAQERRTVSPSPQKKLAEQIRAEAAFRKEEKEKLEKEKLAKLKHEKQKLFEDKRQKEDKMREELEKRKVAAKAKRAEMKKRQEQLKHEEVVLLQELRARRAATKAQLQVQSELTEKQKHDEIARVQEEEKKRKEELEKEEKRRLEEEKKKKEEVEIARLDKLKKKEEREKKKKEFEKLAEVDKKRLEEALLREQERRVHESQKKKEEARKLREQEKLKGEKLKDHKEHKEKPGLGLTPSSKKDSVPTISVTSPPNNFNLNGPNFTTTTPTSQRVSLPKGESSHTKARPATTPKATSGIKSPSSLVTDGVPTVNGSNTPTSKHVPRAQERKEGSKGSKIEKKEQPSSSTSAGPKSVTDSNKLTAKIRKLSPGKKAFSNSAPLKPASRKRSAKKPGKRTSTSTTSTSASTSTSAARASADSKSVVTRPRSQSTQSNPQSSQPTSRPPSHPSPTSPTSQPPRHSPTSQPPRHSPTSQAPRHSPTSQAPSQAPRHSPTSQAPSQPRHSPPHSQPTHSQPTHSSQPTSTSQPLPTSTSHQPAQPIGSASIPRTASGSSLGSSSVKKLKGGGGRKSVATAPEETKPTSSPDKLPAGNGLSVEVRTDKSEEKQNGSSEVSSAGISSGSAPNSAQASPKSGSISNGSEGGSKRKSKIVVPPGKGNALNKLRASFDPTTKTDGQ